MFAERSSFPSDDERDRNDLMKVCSYTADVSGRPRLRTRLREVLNKQYSAGILHKFLASIEAPLMIVVTNYDTMLEEAFKAAGKPYDLVVYPADRLDLKNSLLWWRHGESRTGRTPGERALHRSRKTTVIYKMHGTVVPAGGELGHLRHHRGGLRRVPLADDDRQLRGAGAVLRVFAQPQLPVSRLQPSRLESARRAAEPAPSSGSRARTRAAATTTCRPGRFSGRRRVLDQRLWSGRNVDIFDMDIDKFVEQLATWKSRG